VSNWKHPETASNEEAESRKDTLQLGTVKVVTASAKTKKNKKANFFMKCIERSSCIKSS